MSGDSFSSLANRLLAMAGCNNPNAGPLPGAPPRTMTRLTDDMMSGASDRNGITHPARLFVLRDTDLEAIKALQDVCTWFAKVPSARAAFAKWRKP